MNQLLPSAACNLDSNILLASLPLFSSQKVQGIEWSFDTLFHVAKIPDWFEELLQTYSQANRLFGHGVFFSFFSVAGRRINRPGWSTSGKHPKNIILTT